MYPSYFITAIDTDAGKTVATGLLARYLMERGVRTITLKMAQTGCTGLSDDILAHRRIMGVPLFEEDENGTSCPYIFPFPASPQLSAGLVGAKIAFEKIHEAALKLEKNHDCVLTEGVGGLMVPLVDDLTVLDYLVRCPQPVILVTNGKLGSVNHTLLTLEVLKDQGIELVGMIYNDFIPADPLIAGDSWATLQRYLYKYYPESRAVRIGRWTEGEEVPDFSALFED